MRHPHTAIARGNLGNALEGQGDLEAAGRQYRIAAASFAASQGPDHPNVAMMRSNLSNTFIIYTFDDY